MHSNSTIAPARAPRPVTPHTILSSEIEKLLDRMETVGADPEWTAALARCRTLAAPLEDYLLRCSTQPSAELERLEAATRELDWDAAYERGETGVRLEQEMVSGSLEGQFLKMLVAISGAKNILEVGSFTGYASLAMAEALPPDGHLLACEMDPFAAAFAERHLRETEAGRKVEIRVGPAGDTIAALATTARTFDLVFIDADKQGYLGYFQQLLDHELVPVGGLLCIDNTLYQGQVYAGNIPTENGRALDHFNKSVAADDRVEQVMLPLRDGVTLIRRVR